MSTIQSSDPELASAASAASWHKYIFIAYIVVLGATVILSVLVWISSNKYQDVLKRGADARIATADSRAEEAKRGAAEARAESDKANAGLAKSNEEIARLTAEAEKAKTERVEADKQITIAKADAARAKEGIANAEARSIEASAEVSRLRVTVANAEKERAEAQKALLDLQQRVSNRVITTEQEEKFLAFVSRFKQRGKVTIECPNGTPETVNFGVQIQKLLIKAGWDVVLGTPLVSGGETRFGVNLLLASFGKKTPDDPSYHAAVIAKGFEAAGIEFGSEEVKGQALDAVLLIVGLNFRP